MDSSNTIQKVITWLVVIIFVVIICIIFFFKKDNVVIPPKDEVRTIQEQPIPIQPCLEGDKCS